MRTRQAWLQGMNPNWSLTRPKAIFTERRESNHIDDVHLTPSQALGVLPQDEYMTKSGNRIVLNLSGQDNMKHVEKNDFIIHLRSFQGGIEHSQFKGKVSSAYTVLRPNARIEPRFFRWLLKSSGYIQELNASTDQLRDGQSIKFGQFAAIDLPLPPLEEQRRIADFLDDQVTRIDQVIAIRTLHFNLVAERFKTAIDASFPADPSSRNQRMVAARHRIGVLPGYAFSAERYSSNEDHVRLLRGVNVGLGQLNWADTVYWDADRSPGLQAFEMKPGDVVLGMDRPWIKGGTRIAVVTEDDLPALLLQRVAKLLPGPLVSKEYLFWAYQASSFRDQVEYDLSGVSVPHLSAEQILQHRFPNRPLQEQEVICMKLQETQSWAKSIARDFEVSIELLGERKKALITAAVTGQFDVASARPLSNLFSPRTGERR